MGGWVGSGWLVVVATVVVVVEGAEVGYGMRGWWSWGSWDHGVAGGGNEGCRIVYHVLLNTYNTESID